MKRQIKFVIILLMTGFVVFSIVELTHDDIPISIRTDNHSDVRNMTDSMNTSKEKRIESHANLLSQSHSDETDPNTDMEIYLRMSTINPVWQKFYESVLVQSMKYFWPTNVSMVLVLDNEGQDNRAFGEAAQKSFPYPRPCYMDPITLAHTSGFDRMQRDMFYPERCTSKKYVAFVDTDTMFITRVIPELLFSEGKPIIVGFYGNIWDDRYGLVAQTTANIFMTKEVMRCMSNFPVIFKVEHLVKLRQYVEKIHNKTFDEVLITKAATHLSQFNLMCQYVWMFHRHDYKFRLCFFRKRKTNLIHAREDFAYYEQVLTEEQKMPIARVSLHYKYILGANWRKEGTWRYLLKASICYMGGFDLCPDKCKHLKRDGLRPEMFTFDYIDWLWDKRCISAQKEHYNQVAAYASPWYTDILLNACQEVDLIRWKL